MYAVDMHVSIKKQVTGNNFILVKAMHMSNQESFSTKDLQAQTVRQKLINGQAPSADH